jgi:hypothetical protein
MPRAAVTSSHEYLRVGVFVVPGYERQIPTRLSLSLLGGQKRSTGATQRFVWQMRLPQLVMR